VKKAALAFDTSNYTTSCAAFDGWTGRNAGRLLDVEPGRLGLRQSDALFLHVKNLPSVFAELDMTEGILAVGASAKPRETEESYMPCFLAGRSQGAVLARALDVPFFEFSHQQGHIAAAAWSAGRLDLLDRPHLAWHLSGGTTELLSVRPDGSAVRCEIVGWTTDISAGQLIDRAGGLLGLRFPSGRELDALAQQAGGGEYYKPKLNGLSFSLSGIEHKMNRLADSGAPGPELAYFTVMSVVRAVREATERALDQYGDLPVLFTGGVACNSLLRREMGDSLFASPACSADNALGVAILTYRAVSDGTENI
jgi:N6-L-threonylcarbamoyladenine synthase